MEGDRNANQVVEFLLSDGDVFSSRSFRHGTWHSRIGQWSTADLERVAAAARSDASLTVLEVNLAIVASQVVADRIVAVIRNFRGVRSLRLRNDFFDDGPSMASEQAVDNILLGMCRSTSSLSELILSHSGGRSAIVEFAERFRDIQRLKVLGMEISREFSHGLAKAIGRWQRLRHLCHRATGELRDVARVIKALRNRPRLASLQVATNRNLLRLQATVCEVGAANASLQELSFEVYSEDGDDRAFFAFPRPLSPNLRTVRPINFRFPAANSLRGAPRVLENVTSLKIGFCFYSDGAASLLYVLDSMPHLKNL